MKPSLPSTRHLAEKAQQTAAWSLAVLENSSVCCDHWTAAMRQDFFIHKFDLKAKKRIQDALPPSGGTIKLKRNVSIVMDPQTKTRWVSDLDLCLFEPSITENTQPFPPACSCNARRHPALQSGTVTVLIPAEPPKQWEQLTGVLLILAFKKPRD